jgi:uncharacterized membrane protein
MRSLFVILLLAVFPVVLLSQEERIYTHHSEIVVDTSGVIRVSERIRIYANGDLFKRGITRALPTTRNDVEGKRIKVDYTILEVYKDGEKESYFTEREGSNLVIYVGNKNKLLSPGYYDYEIIYETAGQIGFFEDYDELGWNVNGASDRPVDQVNCKVSLPNNAQILSHRCYTGAFGSTNDSDCTSESDSNGVFSASASNLQPNEMMTIYVGFEKGIVHQPVVKETALSRFLSWLDKMGLWFMNLIIIVPLYFYYITTWRKHGKDLPQPVAIPQFTPPNNMSPASVGMIHDEAFDFSLISTSIINLAVKGFLRIEEVERKGVFSFGAKNYNLVKLKDAESNLPSEEAIVLNELFAESNEVSLESKYNSNVETMMLSYHKDLKLQHKKTLSEGKNLKFKILPWIVLFLYIVLLFYYGSKIPLELFFNFALFSIPTLVVVALLLAIIAAIRKKKQKKLNTISLSIALIVGVIGVFYYSPSHLLTTTAIAVFTGLLFVLLGHILYLYLIVRPGKTLLQLQADIEGLNMYISLAEEKQMQYFNPPKVTPEVFEKLLPYAIALKTEKVWGDKFENTLLQSMQSVDSYAPVWYYGAAMRPRSFTNNLQKSLTSNIQQSAISPKSSGGGNWGSGSFGGGSVGGGGGGGSTGGW